MCVCAMVRQLAVPRPAFWVGCCSCVCVIYINVFIYFFIFSHFNVERKTDRNSIRTLGTREAFNNK